MLADMPCICQASLKKQHGSGSVTALFMVTSTSSPVITLWRLTLTGNSSPIFTGEIIHPKELLKESVVTVYIRWQPCCSINEALVFWQKKKTSHFSRGPLPRVLIDQNASVRKIFMGPNFSFRKMHYQFLTVIPKGLNKTLCPDPTLAASSASHFFSCQQYRFQHHI